MEVLEIIEILEDVVDKSVGIPFIGKSVIDRDELMDLIQEIRLSLPDDLKQAKWVKEERQRILLEAQKESGSMIKNAEEQIISMIDEHEITKKAYEQANEIITNAQNNARELRLGAMQYANDVMTKLENGVVGVLDTIKENRKELKK